VPEAVTAAWARAGERAAARAARLRFNGISGLRRPRRDRGAGLESRLTDG